MSYRALFAFNKYTIKTEVCTFLKGHWAWLARHKEKTTIHYINTNHLICCILKKKQPILLHKHAFTYTSKCIEKVQKMKQSAL